MYGYLQQIASKPSNKLYSYHGLYDKSYGDSSFPHLMIPPLSAESDVIKFCEFILAENGVFHVKATKKIKP